MFQNGDFKQMVYLSVLMRAGTLSFFSTFILISLIGCQSPVNQKNSDEGTFTPVPLNYARGFSMSRNAGVTILSVNRPFQDAEKGLTYLLYPKGTRIPNIHADAYIEVPVQTIVCTSTTHIPLLDYLGVSGALTGFPTTDYISSPIMRKRIDRGEVTDLGVDDALNMELLIDLAPDLVMAYTMTSDYGQFNRMKEAGIEVVLNAEYLEEHPLGRAEWIKFVGALFNQSAMADSVFLTIEQAYLSTQQLTDTVTAKPRVMSGIVYGDSWFLPGGQNYAARLFDHAGLEYIWRQDSSSGFLPLGFETVYEKAGQADLWIGVGSFNTLAEIADADERYTSFLPFKEQKVFSYNKRIGDRGGSGYLELGYLRPDLILKDLVKIGHPGLIPEHELFFFFQLPAKE
jgi:iron complex transport system substrate-binding protein